MLIIYNSLLKWHLSGQVNPTLKEVFTRKSQKAVK